MGTFLHSKDRPPIEGAQERHTTQLLTVPEVAKVLSVGHTMAWKLVREGAIPSVKIGASRRVRRSDLEAYIEGLVPSVGLDLRIELPSGT